MADADDHLRERLQGAREAAVRARERHEAARAKIANGTADPVVYEALRIAYATASDGHPDELSESARGYGEELVIAALENAGPGPDARAIGEGVASELRSLVVYERDPGAQAKWREAIRSSPIRPLGAPVTRTGKPLTVDLPALIREANRPSLPVRVRRSVVGVTVFVAAVVGILAGLHALGAF